MVTVHGPLWSGSEKDAPCRLNSAPTSTNCSPPAVTLGGWFGGGGVGQSTENDSDVDPPAGTLTVRWVPPLTEQLGAIALYTGDPRGLYAVGVGMMASFVFMVSGAWLLIVGVRREEAAEATA